MTKFRINITKEVLERSANCGDKEIGFNCAIALAINNLFQKSWVSKRRISFNHNQEETTVVNTLLPIEARNFINEFDRNSPECRLLMKPFSFEIDVPDIVINEISIDEIKKVLETSITMELVNY